MTFPIEIDKDKRMTFINQKDGKYESEWKKWDELTAEEKEKINLGTPTNDYIIFDFDLKDKYNIEDGNELDRAIIRKEYKEKKEDFERLNITKFYADESRAGFHVFAKFNGLAKLDE